MVLNLRYCLTTVVSCRPLDRFYTPSVTHGVLLNRRQPTTRVCVQMPVEPVLHADHRHLPPLKEGQLNEASIRIRHAARGLDRVIEGVSEKRRDIH